MEGPQFSTKAESNAYRASGFDIIGMTNLQEAKLAREAEICYTTLALVTDYDCWHPDHDSVTVEMIIRNLTENAKAAQHVLANAVERLPIARDCECARALATAIITQSGRHSGRPRARSSRSSSANISSSAVVRTSRHQGVQCALCARSSPVRLRTTT